jgi:hypothetical protein
VIFDGVFGETWAVPLFTTWGMYLYGEHVLWMLPEVKGHEEMK